MTPIKMKITVCIRARTRHRYVCTFDEKRKREKYAQIHLLTDNWNLLRVHEQRQQQ